MLKTVRLSLHPVALTTCVFHVTWSKLLFIVILPEALTIWMLRSYFFRRLGTPECHWLHSTTKYVINRNTHRHTVKTVSKYHRNLWLHRSCSCLSICKAWKTFALWLQRGHRLRNVCADVIRVCVCSIQLHFGKCLFYFVLMAAQARAEQFLTWF